VAANRPATSVPSDAASPDARDNKKSPDRMATKLPHLAFTDGTPRRVSASSITSSWYSEPIWTSSTEMPPVITSSVTTAPPAAAAAIATTGRNRFPPAPTR
jgi:hypothetical protein